MKKVLSSALLTMLAAASTLPASAQTTANPNIKQPEAPFTSISLFEVAEQDSDHFVSDWNKRSAVIAQMPGFIAATLYKSILPDHKYQIINVAQWQSYDAWLDVHNSLAYRSQHSANGPQNTSNSKAISGFYRPAVSYTHTHTEQSASAQPVEGTPLRIIKNPAITNPDAPFVFINLMEMEQKDIDPFLSSWKIRSQLTRKQPGSMGATLYKTMLPDSRYQIVNISQWQSYNAFVDGQNNPTYSSELAADLNQTASIKLTRGFFRPVAYYAHVYD